MHNRAALLCTSFVFLACGGPSGKPRPYAKPSAEAVMHELSERQAAAESFLAESRMEYWVDGKRIKTTVYVMGQRGARVRFNALDPTNVVAADLACDGTNFQFVDFNQNCQLTGPCTKQAIAQLLRVSLEPDDFLMLAIGSTPVIPFDAGKVTWDAKNAHEVVELTSQASHQRQKIILDGREQRWDVLSSTVWDAEGKVDWELTNKEFSVHQGDDGQALRLPAKTRFEQPKAKADLTVRWDERNINIELAPEKFVMELPGLPQCGQKPAP
jgi:outer membrane lipoprotein-sorting protein